MGRVSESTPIQHLKQSLVYRVWLFCDQSLSCVWLFAAPWTIACQAPPSMEFFQARILEQIAISYSRGSSWPRDWTPVSPALADRFFTTALPEKPPYRVDTLQISSCGHYDLSCVFSFPFLFLSDLQCLSESLLPPSFTIWSHRAQFGHLFMVHLALRRALFRL